ncbi:hypothetical protein IFM89_011215 [Coptis chinensis]|uniref:Plant heme peroxidase family profile domain-containing protein n=1 Tax=Coptis chinensis TaxID=261450 RepID=A0A835HLP8_9MAGN|nr:hypothetical protein IFM89_011215 [Coptis chinensis]
MKMMAAVSFSVLLLGIGNAQLSTEYNKKTCPNVSSVVEDVVKEAMKRDARITTSLICLHFHDCFVQVSNTELLRR